MSLYLRYGDTNYTKHISSLSDILGYVPFLDMGTLKLYKTHLLVSK